ncbi:MAG: hypothetical protein COY58_04390 [Gammaproteobacteria bacterium CG_4_10_14_0_8_um_filter_38_16]|nr:MAG: hypothetical protein COY58_04390 [Gammaproteobacteria bacterium CG_4_10_14_0_8_um_filter_38_16]PJA02596.1 MAG: hypothetical protein COX72_09610 [Gammaproteobacteria bacterium CG_4_10_14_0_2_um_filter_38_22]PJB09984.1 MAG: hypothetical protein CO120_07275 [Gammaproteobacteria bacterium CG_4_9_14_3_um_filter_38_9]
MRKDTTTKPFRITHTNQRVEKRAFRKDINMRRQEAFIKAHRQAQLLEANMKDYNTTLATLEDHLRFLQLLVAEAFWYQAKDLADPRTILFYFMSVSDDINIFMNVDGATDDSYMKVSKEIAKEGLFNRSHISIFLLPNDIADLPQYARQSQLLEQHLQQRRD